MDKQKVNRFDEGKRVETVDLTTLLPVAECTIACILVWV
jgi:hypothetical protein